MAANFNQLELLMHRKQFLLTNANKEYRKFSARITCRRSGTGSLNGMECLFIVSGVFYTRRVLACARHICFKLSRGWKLREVVIVFKQVKLDTVNGGV
jgi:hypothetical protein